MYNPTNTLPIPIPIPTTSSRQPRTSPAMASLRPLDPPIQVPIPISSRNLGHSPTTPVWGPTLHRDTHILPGSSSSNSELNVNSNRDRSMHPRDTWPAINVADRERERERERRYRESMMMDRERERERERERDQRERDQRERDQRGMGSSSSLNLNGESYQYLHFMFVFLEATSQQSFENFHPSDSLTHLTLLLLKTIGTETTHPSSHSNPLLSPTPPTPTQTPATPLDVTHSAAGIEETPSAVI